MVRGIGLDFTKAEPLRPIMNNNFLRGYLGYSIRTRNALLRYYHSLTNSFGHTLSSTPRLWR